MADVQPFNALHYDASRVDMNEVTAPPYDVINDVQRAELLARSAHNVVEIDLPKGDDPYGSAAKVLDDWVADGVLVADEEPSMWALSQDYTAPDGSKNTRHGILARVGVTDYGPGKVRPHERTQPGPKQDRLDLTRATLHNMSPIFSLSTKDAWPHIEPATSGEPWAEVTDPDGTVHKLWRVTDPAILAAVTEELSDAELLIADGHHRYETARTYRDEVGGEGGHNFTLMVLTGLADPGLTVFPTHRILTGLTGDSERQVKLGQGIRELFEIEEVDRDSIDPGELEGLGVFGFMDSFHKTPYILRLKDTRELERLMADRSEAYRKLDAAILESLVFSGILGMSAEDVEAKKGLAYAKTIDEALGRLEDDSGDVAFILRPTPIDEVREVAGEGETMPPKSTYFYPKLLSGMAFNPLS